VTYSAAGFLERNKYALLEWTSKLIRSQLPKNPLVSVRRLWLVLYVLDMQHQGVSYTVAMSLGVHKQGDYRLLLTSWSVPYNVCYNINSVRHTKTCALKSGE
jgi:hypothetical protein